MMKLVISAAILAMASAINPAQYPAGVSPNQCPNYPFCGSTPVGNALGGGQGTYYGGAQGGGQAGGTYYGGAGLGQGNYATQSLGGGAGAYGGSAYGGAAGGSYGGAGIGGYGGSPYGRATGATYGGAGYAGGAGSYGGSAYSAGAGSYGGSAYSAGAISNLGGLGGSIAGQNNANYNSLHGALPRYPAGISSSSCPNYPLC